MTVHALLGLLGLNAAILIAGAVVVWSVRANGIRDWGEGFRLAGLAYFVGIGVLGTLCSLLLVAGVALRAWTFGTLWLAVVALALGIGRSRKRALPGSGHVQLTLADAAGLGVCAVLAEALFRAGRLHGLYAWDAWAFWVPKAKLIYWTGTLDPAWLAQLDWPSYPPLLPILEAADFHALGGVDTATLHLQFWVLAVAFVAAVVGLLWTRVPRIVLWPCAILVLAAPRFGGALLEPQADFLVDFLFVLGALLVLLWLVEGDGSLLLLATPLLAGAALTKREGLLFVACLAVTVAVTAGRAGLRHWRRASAPFAVAAAAALAWRLWFTSHHLTGDLPAKLGFADGLDAKRAADSLGLSLRVLVDTGRWSVIPWLGLLGLAVAMLSGSRRLALAVLVLVTLLFLGGAWVTYANPQWAISTNEALNPIVRYTGVIELLLVATAPLLLVGAARPAWARDVPLQLRARPALLGLAALGLGYPALALAHGLPRFPSPADCQRRPVPGQPVAVTFGRFTTERAAARAARRAEAVGFKGLRIEGDGCGRLALWIPNAPDLQTAESVVVEARSAHLVAHAELGHS